jgi:hypothetical protein
LLYCFAKYARAVRPVSQKTGKARIAINRIIVDEFETSPGAHRPSGAQADAAVCREPMAKSIDVLSDQINQAAARRLSMRPEASRERTIKVASRKR